MAERPILFAYDGSDSARHALEQAASRLQGRPAVVLTVWQSVEDIASAARAALPHDVVAQGVAGLDDQSEQEALRTADDGVAVLSQAGVDAAPRAARCKVNIWSTILKVADDLDAETIVMGTRGRSGLKAAVLGSVSAGVTGHSNRPVLVVR